MDILDGTASASSHDVHFRDPPQGRIRPELINFERGESLLIIQPTAGESVQQCFEGLQDFWNTHVVGMRMERIRGLPAAEARTGDIQRAAAHILSDPRSVLRNGIPIPSNRNIFDAIFDENAKSKAEGQSVQAAFKYHCRLVKTVFVDVKLVLELTTSLLHGDDRFGKQASEVEDLVDEQQRRIESLVFKSMDEKQLVQHYGVLSAHPSLLFVYGWLCYKSGTGPHLLRAITMLTEAGKRGLLRATCGILRALSRFYIIWEAQEPMSREFVIAALMEALAVAGRSEEHDVVETPLLVEGHAALAVLFTSSAEDDGDEQREVLPEIQRLRARRHCLDAHRLFHLWRRAGSKLPSRLLLRASRVCGVDAPGSMDWQQTEHVLSRISGRWRKFGGMPERVDRSVRRIAVGRGSARAQLSGYESFAAVMAAADDDALEQVEAEAARWSKTRHSLELRKQPPRRICQLCGAVAAAMPCNRCKTVVYCSNSCAHFDRIAGAHAIICIGRD